MCRKTSCTSGPWSTLLAPTLVGEITAVSTGRPTAPPSPTTHRGGSFRSAKTCLLVQGQTFTGRRTRQRPGCDRRCAAGPLGGAHHPPHRPTARLSILEMLLFAGRRPFRRARRFGVRRALHPPSPGALPATGRSDPAQRRSRRSCRPRRPSRAEMRALDPARRDLGWRTAQGLAADRGRDQRGQVQRARRRRWTRPGRARHHDPGGHGGHPRRPHPACCPFPRAMARLRHALTIRAL